MKDKLYSFYKLPKKKVEDIWKKGLLIMDTNVLLDLYRLGKVSRNDLKKSIDYFGDRVWIPFQVGLEFHRNRESVIKDFGNSKYEEFKKLIDEKVTELKDAFISFQRHPCIDYSSIEQSIDRFKNELEKKEQKWRKEYPFHIEDDDVLDWVTKKFDGKVGEDNTKEELLEICKDGAIRYRAQVPPGYKDANDKDKKEAGERFVYGDLIVWKAVMCKAKTDKKDVIFLTNDNKEDWFERYKGKAKGPRFELIREFYKETGKDIIIMSEATFLKEMKEKTTVKVKDSSIEDAENALKADSNFDWLRPLTIGWPINKPLTASSYSPNTIIDIPGSLGNFEPVVLKGLPLVEEYPNLLVDPKTGFIDSGYLDSLKNRSIWRLGQDDNKKDEK